MSSNRDPRDDSPPPEDQESATMMPAPPSHTEAEQGLMSMLLLRNGLIHEVADILQVEHFVEEAYASIWAAMMRLTDKNVAITPISLLDPCVALLQWDRTEVMKLFTALAKSAVSTLPSQAIHYAKLIKDAWIRRQLFEAAEVIKTHTRTKSDATGADILEEVEAKLFAISAESSNDERAVNFSDALGEAMRQAQAAASAYEDGKMPGVGTGLGAIDRKLGGFRDSDFIVVGAATGMGKAQPLDAKVLLQNGRFGTMGSLKVGDRLASIDENPSRVVAIYPQGMREVYRVTFSDGRSTEACGEHLWRVNQADWRHARTVTTLELKELLRHGQNKQRLWIQQTTGEFGISGDLPIHPWLLGVLLGDGCLVQISPSISSADPEIITRAAAILGDGFRFVKSGKYDYRIVKAAGNDGARNPLTAALKALGVWGRKSDKKFIPEQYLCADRETRLELLRGLMDTDGWAERHGSIRFVSTSPKLALGVQALVRSLGGICRIVEKRPHFTYKGVKKAGLLAYQCNIRHADPGSLFFLERKTANASAQHIPKLKIESIVLSRITESQCIKVSHRSHTYITDEYIVTHNTAWMCKVAISAARQFLAEKPEKPKWVYINSLEMSADQLALRMAAAEARISFERIRLGQASPEDLQELEAASQRLRDLPIRIDDTPGITVPAIRARLRRWKRKHGLGLAMVDYLQLVGSTAEEQERTRGNRVQEMSLITRGCKTGIAKGLDIPLVALAQLSRKLEEREDKRPQMSDLRESGTIEQDADVVAFIYREVYYMNRRPPQKKERETEIDYGIRRTDWAVGVEKLKDHAEFLIAKNRHGSTGSPALKFIPELMLFVDDSPGDATQGGVRKQQLAMDLEDTIG